MRRIVHSLPLAVLVALAAAQGGGKGPPETRQVQVREAHLREQPSFLGRIVRRLPYETAVVVEGRHAGGTWLNVTTSDGGAKGWLAESALARPDAKLKASSGDAEARAGRTSRSLAGRGFSEEVERARRDGLRSGGSNVEEGYRKLDELLAKPAYSVDPSAVPDFAREGGLGGGR